VLVTWDLVVDGGGERYFVPVMRTINASGSGKQTLDFLVRLRGGWG